VIRFVGTQELLGHQHGRTQLSALNDQNITHTIKEALGERAQNGFLLAMDVMEVVLSLEIQAQLFQAGIYWPSIAKSTACHWLGKLGWQHGRHQNGKYSDSHEWEDVVEYRRWFVERFGQHEYHFHNWDDEGKELPLPSGFLVPGEISCFHLVLITHDKYTFYQNDQCQTYWGYPGKNVMPRPNGDVTDAYIFFCFYVEVLIIRYDKMVSHMMSICAFTFVIKAHDPGKDLPYQLLDMCKL
jgi:hypothetical protein